MSDYNLTSIFFKSYVRSNSKSLNLRVFNANQILFSPHIGLGKTYSLNYKIYFPTGAPGPYSQFLVESKLPIYFCYFLCFILVTLCSLLYLSVFHVWSLSVNYILLTSVRILVLFITLHIVIVNCWILSLEFVMFFFSLLQSL